MGKGGSTRVTSEKSPLTGQVSANISASSSTTNITFSSRFLHRCPKCHFSSQRKQRSLIRFSWYSLSVKQRILSGGYLKEKDGGLRRLGLGGGFCLQGMWDGGVGLEREKGLVKGWLYLCGVKEGGPWESIPWNAICLSSSLTSKSYASSTKLGFKTLSSVRILGSIPFIKFESITSSDKWTRGAA